jgi:serine protease Do
VSWACRGAILVAAALLPACGAAAAKSAEAPAPNAGGDPICRAIDPLLDAYGALQSGTGSPSDVSYLVDLDGAIGALHIARAEVAPLPSPQAATIASGLGKLGDALSAKRDRVAEALTSVQKSYEIAERALDDAARCQRVDLRDDDLSSADRAKVAARACEPARRLWEAASSVDLTSDIASSSIAAQVTELRMTGDRAEIRTRLAVALKAHAEALKHLKAVAEPRADQQDAAAQALVSLNGEVSAQLRSTRRFCLEHLGDSGRIAAGSGPDNRLPSPDARLITVTVRPRWSGTLEALPHDEEFGSGFIVRWRTPDGHVETRIVTNDHVMDGAFEADIVSGDATASGKGDSAAKAKISATLVQANPIDDVAILRVDPSAEAAFGQGVAFRFAPAREQEQVVAAGFPGVGITPSFQVSRGAVSNARFGADNPEDGATSAYVQHTAPIDPGNSGGPLLDAEGHLLGMNTLKIVGRENVGLAIPTARIQAALMRAERAPTFDTKLAEASCNAAVAVLASRQPPARSMAHFGLPLFEATAAAQGSTRAAAFREQVQGQADNPVEVARLRAYGSVRSAVADEGGVRPYELCSGVKASGAGDTFVGTFRTRTKAHQITLAPEHGELRVVKVE